MMVHYSGITNDLARRKREHQDDRTKKNMRNWRVANDGKPFSSRALAQAWEDSQLGEHYPGGAPATGPWYGYSFDYDK